MEILQYLEVPLIIFVLFVVPLWLIAHYVTRWRMAKTITGEDESLLSDLWASARRMEDRIQVLERILDAEAPGWRTKP